MAYQQPYNGAGSMYPSYHTRPTQYPQQQYHSAPPPLQMPSHMPPTPQHQQPYHGHNMSPDSDSVPPSPSDTSEEAVNRRAAWLASMPDIPPIMRIYKGKVYSLHIGQQPVRARMCGFGDKVGVLPSETLLELQLTHLGSTTYFTSSMFEIGHLG